MLFLPSFTILSYNLEVRIQSCFSWHLWQLQQSLATWPPAKPTTKVEHVLNCECSILWFLRAFCEHFKLTTNFPSQLNLLVEPLWNNHTSALHTHTVNCYSSGPSNHAITTSQDKHNTNSRKVEVFSMPLNTSRQLIELKVFYRFLHVSFCHSVSISLHFSW